MPVAAHQAMAPTTTKANAPANLAAIKARSAQFQDYFSAPAPGLNRSAVAIDKLMGASANSGDASAHTALADATNGTANQIFAIYGHPAHRRSAVADDEAGQFDVRRSVTPSKHSRGAESGIGPIRSDSYGLSASHSGGPPPGLNLPNRRVVEHRQRRHQFARHSLSSWPPSPGDAMPPMPTFIVSSPHIKNDPTQRASYSNIPPAGYQGARAKKPQANESSLISGGNARVATTASYQAAPHAESPSPDSPVTTATSTEPAPRTSATKPLVPSPATEAAIRRAVPSPTELLRVANESARSSAATYLSDWVSEVVWEMCVPIMGVNGASARESLSYPHMGNGSNVVCPPSFKRFAQQTIYQVSASAGSCFLALWYIEHLPIGPVLSDIDNLIIYDTPQRSFRDDLIATRAEIPWRLLTLGLTLANKWLEDNTFTMKTWNEVTGLNIGMMKVLEAKALGLFNWILNPDMGLWEEFLHKLRHREVMIHAGHLPGAIGSERRLSMSFSEPATLKRPIRVIDELIAEAAASKVVKEPVFPGAVPPFSPVETASSAPSPVSPATSVADSFGSVSAASSVRSIPHPLPSPHAEPEWSARRASWTSEINFDFARDDPPVVFGGHSRRVKTPAEWNPLVDESVGRRTRPVYEAVQRPNSLLLIPPPAAYEDYVAPGFAGVPPAKYAEHNPRQQVMSMYALGTTIPRVPQYEQAVNGNGASNGNGMIDRVWSDARNIMPDLRANWAPSLAGY